MTAAANRSTKKILRPDSFFLDRRESLAVISLSTEAEGPLCVSLRDENILDLALSPDRLGRRIALPGVGCEACAEWRSIPGWPEYQVSDTGAVRRVGCASGARVGRILRQLRNKNTGYFSVCLSQHAVQVRIDVHRLVAIAFHGPRPSADHLVAHNDGSRTNNHASNLRWATQSENVRDCRGHGTALLGVRNPMSRLDEVNVKSIRRMKVLGIPRPVIAEGFGLHKRTVFKSWRAAIGGMSNEVPGIGFWPADRVGCPSGRRIDHQRHGPVQD